MRSIIFSLMLAASLLQPVVAQAFCRTTVCSQKKSKRPECNPGVFDGTCQMAGKPLAWKEKCTSFSTQVGGSPKYGIKATDLETLGNEAFKNWEAASCSDGAHPNVYVAPLGEVDCDEVRYNTNGPNQNVWVFRDEEGLEDPQVIALTSVSFSPDTGEIYDADLEFNSRDFSFVIGNAVNVGDVDLASVIQHESGHVLGLAHSDVPAATMFASYGGRVEMRSLDTDDFDGICAAYPPADASAPALSTTCNIEPRHGFSTQCAGPAKDGCSCSVPGRNSSGHQQWGWWVGLAAAAAYCSARSRKRRQWVAAPAKGSLAQA